MKLSKEVLIALGITGIGLGCVHTESGGPLTREQLDRMLEEMAKTPIASTPFRGAMCYMSLGPRSSCLTLFDALMRPRPPERVKYLCPVCKTKTYHTSYTVRRLQVIIHTTGGFRQTNHLQWSMERIKELGVDAVLDVSDLCSKCRQDKNTDTVNFYILITEGERSIRTQLEPYDLLKIIAFLNKEDIGDDELRIRKILGMDDDGKQDAPQQKN